MGLRIGPLAVARVPNEVFGRSHDSVLHRVLGCVFGGFCGQHVGGTGGLQEREDAIVTDQHIHRKLGRG